MKYKASGVLLKMLNLNFIVKILYFGEVKDDFKKELKKGEETYVRVTVEGDSLSGHIIQEKSRFLSLMYLIAVYLSQNNRYDQGLP